MFRRFLPMVLPLLMLTSGASQAADPPENLNALLRVRSLKALIDDAKYLAELEQGAQAVQRIDEDIDKTFGKDHAGFDVKKPAGIYASITEKNVESIVMLLPIADRKAFLAQFAKWFGNVQEHDGLYSTGGGWFTPRFFRFAGDYVHLTWNNSAEILAKDRLLDPAKVLASDRDATLSLTFNIQGFALELRRNVLQNMNLFASETTEKLPGETEVQRKLRVQVVANISRWLAMLAEDGDRFEILIGVDRPSAELYFELHLSGKANSRLAESIAQMAQAKSRFAALSDSGAMKLLLHWPLADDLTHAIRPVVDEAVRRTMQNSDADTIRTQAISVAMALEPTLDPGDLDIGFHLASPGKDKLCSLILGLKVREGEKIDAALRSLVKSLPERDRERFKFDVGRAAGVSIHRADVADFFDEKLLSLFGNQPIHFSISGDAALVALGPGGLNLLKEGLAAQPKLAPQIHYELAVLPLLPLVTDAELLKKLDPVARDTLKEPGSDRVRFTVSGGKTLQARLAVKAPVLKFLTNIKGEQGRFWRLFW